MEGNKVKELQLDALTENLDRVLEFIEEQLEQYDCPNKTVIQIKIAVEELFVNIAHYAYGEETGYAIIQTETEAGKIKITLIDGGMHYNPLEKKDPDVTLSAEERQIGGLGIYMVKKSMDSVEYEYVDEKNCLTITKTW